MRYTTLAAFVVLAILVSCTSSDGPGPVSSHRVVYHGNGNTSGTPPVDTNEYVASTNVAVMDNTGVDPLVRTSFQFGGWNTQQDGSGTSYGSAGSYLSMAPSDVDLWAVWIPDGMTFTSDSLGICITGTSSPPVGVLTIPPGATKIGLYAFQSCPSITGLSLPVSLLAIDQFAFDGCTLLGAVTVPSGVVQLQWASFSGCTALTSVSLGAYVITISSQAFYGDSSLGSITILSQTPPTLELGAFDNLATGLQIHVPAGRQSVYKATAVWSNYAANIQ